MRFTDRVISLHPTVVTIVFLVLFLGGGIAVNTFDFGSPVSSLIFSVAMALSLGPLMLWHYSLYRAASDRNASNVGHSGRRAIFFLLSVGGTSALLIIYSLIQFVPENAERPAITFALSGAMMIGNLSYFGAIWAASNALTRFDERAKVAEVHKTLGTFFLALYLPIGIWVIYPRIRRLLAEPVTAPADVSISHR